MIRLLFSISLTVIVTGCSIFQGSRKIDMTPFSDNAETMFGEAVKISRPFQWKHLKSYTSVPELRELFIKAVPVLEALRGIVYYSNQVAAINNARISDKEKNRQLALYLQEVIEKALKKQEPDSIRLNLARAMKILDNIRNAEKYIDGIAAASPIVNAIVITTQDLLDEIEADIPKVLTAFDREIEEDYGVTRNNFREMRFLQNKTMILMTKLYRAQIGDVAELDTLMQMDVSLKKYFDTPGTVSQAQMAAAEKLLAERLEQIDVMFKQLEDAKYEYIAKQDELVVWRNQVDEKIRIARSAITIWAQSHRNLGAGVPVPPMIDVAGFASGLAGNAAKTVIP